MRATPRVSRTLAIGIVARVQALLWQYIQFIYTLVTPLRFAARWSTYIHVVRALQASSL
jgi:hypothetical protein